MRRLPSPSACRVRLQPDMKIPPRLTAGPELAKGRIEGPLRQNKTDAAPLSVGPIHEMPLRRGTKPSTSPCVEFATSCVVRWRGARVEHLGRSTALEGSGSHGDGWTIDPLQDARSGNIIRLGDPMKIYFQKRIYTVSTLVRDLLALIPTMRQLALGRDSGNLNRAFIERIMLAVTQVNDCRYCTYAHTRAAIDVGVSQSEVDAIMRGEFDGAPEDEQVALRFAEHYAERSGRPHPAAKSELMEAYGAEMAARILPYVRMITLGNLLGNTFDALLSRFRGRPTQEGSLASEVGVLVTAFLMIPFVAMVSLPIIIWGRLFTPSRI